MGRVDAIDRDRHDRIRARGSVILPVDRPPLVPPEEPNRKGDEDDSEQRADKRLPDAAQPSTPRRFHITIHLRSQHDALTRWRKERALQARERTGNGARPAEKRLLVAEQAQERRAQIANRVIVEREMPPRLESATSTPREHDRETA